MDCDTELQFSGNEKLGFWEARATVPFTRGIKYKVFSSPNLIKIKTNIEMHFNGHIEPIFTSQCIVISYLYTQKKGYQYTLTCEDAYGANLNLPFIIHCNCGSELVPQPVNSTISWGFFKEKQFLLEAIILLIFFSCITFLLHYYKCTKVSTDTDIR